MFLIYKGKGFLLILYFAISLIGIGLIHAAILEFAGGSNSLSGYSFGGLILVVTGIWSRLTSNDSFKTKSGEKIYMDLDHEFFFIHMKTWGIILPIAGALLIIYGVLSPFFIASN